MSERDENSDLVSRRNVLKTAAAAGVISTVPLRGQAAPSSSGTISAPADAGGDGTGKGSPGYSFTETLNAVEDLEMDNGGNEPIDDKLKNNISDNTLIKFPEGTYVLSEGLEQAGLVINATNFGMVGLGSERNDVKFKPPDGKAGVILHFDGRNTYIANCVFDQTHENAQTRIKITQDGDHYQYNTAHIGKGKTNAEQGPPLGPDNNTHQFAIVIRDPDAVCHIENYQNVDGDTMTKEYPDNRLCIQVPTGHKGLVELINPRIENVGEEAVYACKFDGDIHIERGWFQNNLNVSCRIAGEGSYIKDTVFVNDMPKEMGKYVNAPGYKAARLIRSSSEKDGKMQTGGLVENCQFIIDTDMPKARGIEHFGSSGRMTYKDCVFQQNQGDLPIIDIHEVGYNGNNPPQPWGDVVKNCSFTGDTSQPAISSNRPGSVARDNCVSMPNSEGITGDIDESGTTNGQCRTPSLDTGGDDGGNDDGGNDDGGNDDGGNDDGGNDDGGNDDGGDDDGGSSLPRGITLVGHQSDQINYSFGVSGDVEGNNGIESNDSVGSDGQVAAAVDSYDQDNYRFSGDFEYFNYSGGDLRVTVDGQSKDPDNLGGSDGGNDGGGSSLPNGVTIVGHQSDQINYSFGVSGDLEGNSDIESNDSVGSDGQVAAAVDSYDQDNYRFSGDFEYFNYSGGDLRVTVNGQSKNPDNLGGSSSGGGGGGSSLPRGMTVVGHQSDQINYSFGVSGDLEGNNDIESNDNVGSDGQVAAAVDSYDQDNYRFSGEVEYFNYSGGDLRVNIDGQSRDPDSF